MATYNNGLVTTAMVVKEGIPRGSLQYLVKQGRIERASRGYIHYQVHGKMNLLFYKVVIRGGFIRSIQCCF